MRKLSVSLFLLTICAQVYCWGPVSHLYFACQAASSHWHPGALEACVNSQTKGPSLFWGGLLPDGLTIDPFLSNNNCSWLVHDGVFSGKLYLEATKRTDPDLINFSVGFAAHIMTDLEGFFTSDNGLHGYMTKKYPVDWTMQWFFMAAVDAHIIRLANVTSIPTGTLDPKLAKFLSEMSFEYHAENPKFPALTEETISTCANNWMQTVTTMTARGKQTPSQSYLQDLLFFDTYGATTQAEAVGHFELANKCAVGIFESWLDGIQATQDASKTFSVIAENIKNSYVSGTCIPK